MNRQNLIDAYATAFKFRYDISRTQRGLIYDEEQRTYVLAAPDKPLLHYVETVLLGREECTGDWLRDAAAALETSLEYIQGFIDGMSFQVLPTDYPR